MTTNTKPDAEKLLEEERGMGAEIERLEAERAELESPAPTLTWDEIQDGAAEDLEKGERRRGILPRLIKAARIKQLELRRERYRAELGPLLKLRDKAHEEREAATRKRLQALEDEGAAAGKYSEAQMHVLHREGFARQVDRDLRTLKGNG